MREIAVRAPGRVNLIGEHTDYNDGFVLPLAIDRDCRVVGRAVPDGLRLRFADGGDANSQRIADAVREALVLRGVPSTGLDAVVSSTIPIGGGLSSSSALAVAIATALCTAADSELPPVEIARACREAETAATGVPSGIMDQLASAAGRAGCALLIDCRTLAVTAVPLPAELEIVVVDSAVPRRLANSAYAERRAHCEAAARRLGIAALRDATLEQVEDDPFARHVVSENARVLAAVEALTAHDATAVGELMLASHASLRDDYRVSTPELDLLVDALVTAGAYGARLTGGGFGGCVVALADEGAGAQIADRACEDLRAATGLDPRPFLVRAADGAGSLSPG